VRTLQARETMLDIRKWVAKAWLTQKCSPQSFVWMASLRFFHEFDVMSLQVEKIELAGLVLPTIQMVPVSPSHAKYGTDAERKELQAMLRIELEIPYNGPPIFASPFVPTEPGRTTSWVGAAPFSGKVAPHDYSSFKIRRFGKNDAAMLFGAPWKTPLPPPCDATTPRHATTSRHSTTSSPLTKWSPCVKHMRTGSASSQVECPRSNGGSRSNAAQELGQRGAKVQCATDTRLKRMLKAVDKPLDEHMSVRLGDSLATRGQVANKCLANQVFVQQHTLLPRRPASAKFHSGMQMRALTMHANDLAQRTDDALRMQIVHAPGKSLAQRLSTLKSILSDSNMLGLFLAWLSLTVAPLVAASLAHLLALLLLSCSLAAIFRTCCVSSLALSCSLVLWLPPPLSRSLSARACTHTNSDSTGNTCSTSYCIISATHCNTLKHTATH